MPCLSQPRPRRHLVASAVLGGAALLLVWAGCQQTASTPAPAAKLPSAARPLPPEKNVAVAQFHKVVEPILKARCYDCHGDGESKGGLAFDKLTNDRIANDPQLWLKVLR